MTTFEVSIRVDDDRSDEDLAEAILSVLPDNAALSIRRIDNEDEPM